MNVRYWRKADIRPTITGLKRTPGQPTARNPLLDRAVVKR